MTVRWRRVAFRGAFVFAAVALAVTKPDPARHLDAEAVSTARPQLQRLVDATAREPNRLVEGRLTGGFRYAPPPTPKRSGPNHEISLSVRVETARIERDTSNDETPSARAAFATALLLDGRVSRAIVTLEDAVRLEPQNAFWHSDLATAYIARADEEDRPDDLARAIAASERALRANPRLSEAWFGRALGLEKLGLREESRKAWLEAAERQDERGWRDEALRRARVLGAQPKRDWNTARRLILERVERDPDGAAALVASHRDLAREWIEDVALPSWGAAWLRHDGKAAAQSLSEAHAIAGVLRNANGDRMPLAGVDAIERQRALPQRTRIDDLAAAHVAFGTARTAFIAGNPSEAARLLAGAAKALAASGSPYEHWVHVYSAIAERTRGNTEQAQRALQAVPDGARKRFRYLDARVSWLTGVRFVVGGDLDRAGEAYGRALRAFEQGGEEDSVVALLSVLAEHQFFAGDLVAAWRHVSEALRRVDGVRTPAPRALAVNLPGFFASWQGLPETALHFRNAYVAFTEATGDRARRPEALLNRAQTLGELGQLPAAHADIGAAETALRWVADQGRRDWFRGDILAARGVIASIEGGEDAAEPLRRALNYFEKRDAPRTMRLHLALGRVEKRHGRLDAAFREYLEGIEHFENLRAKWASEDTRLSAFDESWSLFDDMIRMHASDSINDARRSLEFAERGRAVELFQAVHGRSALRLDFASIQAALPPVADILFYAALDDRLLTWHVTRDAVDLHTELIPRGQLDANVRSFVEAMGRQNVEQVILRGHRLYALLIGGIASRLRPGAPLVIVGDGLIQQVPFAALSTPNGRFLVEERTISMAPSLSLLVQARSSDNRPTRSALIVTPSGGREVGPALPFAAAEGRQIAALYAGAEVLIGQSATAEAFLQRGAEHDIIHFAGHSVANQMYPALSYLQFSPDQTGGRGGRLFAPEISRRWTDVPPRLVVLASCASAAGRVARGEGMLSLARPFLASGASAVVSTLWDIEDRGAELLFVRFHEQYRRGVSPAEALRQAQLAVLSAAGARAAHIWAAVVISGGESNLVHQRHRS